MEQRNDRQIGFRLRQGQGIAPPKHRHRAIEGGGHYIGAEIAMGAERSFGIARRAAGVEDRRVIVGCDFGGGQIIIRQVGVAAWIADDLLQPDSIGVRIGRDACCDDRFQFRAAGKMRSDPLEPFGIADQQLRTGVGQPIGKFLPGPPSVQRNADRAHYRGGEEGDRPFRQIAHGQCNTVALADPASLQIGREYCHRAKPCVVGNSFILIDDESPVTMTATDLRHVAEARRSVLPDARRNAPDGDRFHREARIGRCQQVTAFAPAAGRPASRPRPIAGGRRSDASLGRLLCHRVPPRRRRGCGDVALGGMAGHPVYILARRLGPVRGRWQAETK